MKNTLPVISPVDQFVTDISNELIIDDTTTPQESLFPPGYEQNIISTAINTAELNLTDSDLLQQYVTLEAFVDLQLKFEMLSKEHSALKEELAD